MRSRGIATVFVAAALALSACSSSDQDSEAAGDVVVWHMESTPERVAAWEALAEEYNETGPDLEVTIQVQEWDQVYSTVASTAQSGTQPDVLFAIPDFATYVRGLGLGAPVTDLVNDLDEQYGFIDAATAAYTDDGDVWAVPMYGMVQMLWYQKQMFADAGLEEPGTWSELLAAAEELTTDDASGIALPAGNNLASDQVLYSVMVSGGAANMFAEDGSVAFNTPETVAALDLYNELLAYSPADSGSYAWAEPQAALNSGAAAMAIEKGQYLAPWEAESGQGPEDLGCAPIPVADDGGVPGSIYYSNGAMILSEDEARQDGASQFLSWLLEPEQYGAFLNAEPGLFLPVTEDGADLESWREHEVISTYSECVDAMLEQSATGELFGFTDGQYIAQVGEISGQNILAQVVQEMYVNGMSPADAAAWGEERMQAAID